MMGSHQFLPMGRMLMLSAYAYGSALASPHPSLSPLPPKGEGSNKNIFKASKKNKASLKKQKIPWNPSSLWPLHQFGDKTVHFCGTCIVLEVERLVRKVFAGHWT